MTCEHQGVPVNGRIIGFNEWRCGHSITYSCDDGFYLRGASTIHCLSTGQWSAPKPSCISTSINSTGKNSDFFKYVNTFLYTFANIFSATYRQMSGTNQCCGAPTESMPPPKKILSILCSLGGDKILQYRMLAPPGGLGSPPMENPDPLSTNFYKNCSENHKQV